MTSHNKILAGLSAVDRRRLHPSLEAIIPEFGRLLQRERQAIRHVYFPEDGVVSLLVVVPGEEPLEIGMVGNEGMVGVESALGATHAPWRAVVQGKGTLLRLAVGDLAACRRGSPALRIALDHQAGELLWQFSRTAACNRFHKLPQRLARWLLMTRDRMHADHFHLTHEFLAHMLGVQRAGISHAAHTLQVAGLIAYRRGDIEVLDGPGLEGAACTCYRPPGGGRRRALSRRTTS